MNTAGLGNEAASALGSSGAGAPSATRAFYDFWRAWFAQPAEAKEPFRRVKGPCAVCSGTGYVACGRDDCADAHVVCTPCDGKGNVNEGNWYPPGSESPGYSGKPDPKEYFHWTLRDARAGFGREPNSAMFWACYDIASGWCKVRGLADLARACRPEDCVLRILHYLPTADGLAGEAHRDFDLLTVNVGGTCPGLEVLEAAPGVLPRSAPLWTPREGGIHAGEMLEIYSNPNGYPRPSRSMRQFNATPHRVRIPPNTERFAAVFFYLPPDGFVLRPGLTAQQYLADAMGKAGTAQGAKR